MAMHLLPRVCQRHSFTFIRYKCTAATVPLRANTPPQHYPRLQVQQAVGKQAAPADGPFASLLGAASSAVTGVVETAAQCMPAIALATLWLLGRSAPATAGILPRSANLPQLESMVSIPPQASVTASVTSPNDSMLLIVLVCLGFYALSATISAAIGAIMHLSGRSLNYGTRGAASWSAGGIMDTFDIMRLPLAYELDEPAGSGRSQTVQYIPWDGPEPAYIPVNMVKVLQPGMLEAGLVVRQPLMQPDATNLSIISVTSSPGQQQLPDEALQRLNGNCGSTNGNGKGNGRSNGSNN